MKAALLTPLLAACALGTSLGASPQAGAAPIVEAGESVARADFSLTFDSIATGMDLSNYQEGGIFVTTPSVAYTGMALFFPLPKVAGYHYPDSGNWSYTSIRGANHEVFTAADFLLGNGWAMPSNYLRYASYLGGVLTGEGVYEMDSGVVRISDLNGFDELRLNSHWQMAAHFGGFQAIALDDLHLQLRQDVQVAEPGQIALFGAALLGWAALRRRG